MSYKSQKSSSENYNFAKIIEICLNVLDRENGIASSLTSMQVFKHCDSTGFIHTLKKNVNFTTFLLQIEE